MVGIVSKVLKSIRETLANGDKVTDVQANTSANANLTCHLYLGPGEDSLPLPDDFCMLIPTKKSGVYSVIGFLDTKSNQTAKPGEKRIYARNSDGEEVCQIYLKNDGSVSVSNEKGNFSLSPNGEIKGQNDDGSFALLASGNINLNGVVIDTSGNVSGVANFDASGAANIEGEVTANAGTPASVTLSGHNHPTAPTGPVSPPTPGT